MVTNNEIKRDTPEYSLNRIQALASRSKLTYGSKDVQRDITNLSYSLADVCECLSSLNTSHYVKSIRYQNTQLWLDVYCYNWRLTGQQTDPLYVKLKLNKD